MSNDSLNKIKKLKILMLNENISSLQLAQALNIHQSSLSLFLRGWKKMPEPLLTKAILFCKSLSQKKFAGDKNVTI